MVLLLAFAFLSGFVTILAPCIWPLLPIILSSSLNGGKAKSLGLTLGIMTSFSVLILSISYLVRLFGLDPNVIRLLAVLVLVIMGLSLIIPSFSHMMEGLLSRLSGKFGPSQTKRGFIGGFITGCSLGVIWTPCTGPILATVATLAATSNISLGTILVTIVYVTGLGIPLFFFSYSGGRIIAKTRFVNGFTGIIQRIFGFIILLTALAIYTNFDKVIQIKLLDLFPSYTQFLIGLESNPGVKKQLDVLKGVGNQKDKTVDKPFDIANSQGLPNLGIAPEFTGITKWLNLPNGKQELTMQDLRGKVVLLDVWTYTCINCIRTLPHVTSWYEKYKDQGFVVIGLHSPEFEFEKKTENVQNAIKQYTINYPVAQDNDFATWRAYNNEYWPAEYLIDKDGHIRHVHFGEGNYNETESAIQSLLKEIGKPVINALDEKPDETPKTRLSPETYLGSARMMYYFPNGALGNGTQNLTLKQGISQNTYSLGGIWNITNEQAEAGESAVLELNFTAEKVFLVLRPGNTISKIKVLLDGKAVDSTNAGTDVQDGIITVNTDRLYNLIDLKGKVENHILRLEFQTPGIEVFAFTFG